jgi:glycolate dehydrogenase iron-sulfur subunit
MRHRITAARISPQATEMASAVGSCVHCGFCLSTCPTYATLGEEMDSPRGRILLMKHALEGDLDRDSASPFIDNCLGCQACVTACPSGVEYGDLITAYRAWDEQRRARPPIQRMRRMLLLSTLAHPPRFRLTARLGRLVRPVRHMAPAALRPMLELIPDGLPRARPLPALYPAHGERRARVALLAGCAQQVLAPEIGWATLEVLARNGVETIIPEGQGCCGALAMHAGAANQAKALARRNLRAFPSDIDAVLTNAAGCGSGMHDYPLLFKGDPDAEQARRFSGRVLDVSVFLAALGPVTPPSLREPLVLAYHDACHLAHAQGVRSQPRALLNSIPNLTLVEPVEWELCCGSAGTYNIEKPQIARELGERKARNLIATGAQAIASGNIGCLAQLRSHLRRLGADIPVVHTMEILARAYAGAGSTVTSRAAGL